MFSEVDEAPSPSLLTYLFAWLFPLFAAKLLRPPSDLLLTLRTCWLTIWCWLWLESRSRRDCFSLCETLPVFLLTICWGIASLMLSLGTECFFYCYCNLLGVTL